MPTVTPPATPPDAPTPPRRVIVWAEPHQIPLVRAVAASAGFRIVGAGSPAKGQTGLLAAELAADPVDDLRQALTEADADLVWLAASGDFGAAPEDARAVMAARARALRVASLEPFPARALDLPNAGWTTSDTPAQPIAAVRFVGLARATRAYLDAAEPLAAFGQPRTVLVETLAPPAYGTLGARLLSAIDLILALLGEPETIDAAYTAPKHAAGLHALPGETLHDLHGDLVATLRFPDGRAASITASNHAARWDQTVTLLSAQGRIRLHDDAFTWLGHDGAVRDELLPPPATRAEPRGIATVAAELARLLDPSLPDPGPTPIPDILAVAHAALLSARTGQPESPTTIRRMMATRI